MGKLFHFPTMPNGALVIGCAFSLACGAWSVAIQSIVPSNNPSNNARLYLLYFKGGFILKIALSLEHHLQLTVNDVV